MHVYIGLGGGNSEKECKSSLHLRNTEKKVRGRCYIKQFCYSEALRKLIFKKSCNYGITVICHFTFTTLQGL